jgi:hypothetical protein
VIDLVSVGELFTEVAGVDEQKSAVIGDDCPAPTGGGDADLTDLHAVSGGFPEILSYDARLFIAVAGIDADALAHNKLRSRGVRHASVSRYVITIHKYYLYKMVGLKAAKEIKLQAY